MVDDAEAERKARAERLRQRSGKPAPEAPGDADKTAPKPESGRDFVHRRMSEIDQEKGRK
jgi:hypothetical protein